MKYNVPLSLVFVFALVGCNLPQRQEVKVRRVTILDSGDQSPSDDELMQQLKNQQDAVAKAGLASTGDQTAPPVAVASPTSPETAPLAAPQSELTVDGLIAQLEKKEARTPAEDEVYKRLLGVAAPPVPPAGTSDAYTLLGQARDSLLKADYEVARERVFRVLQLVREKTNPVIERVYFATEVRSYGNGDVVSPAEFRRGQRILVVADLSNFACRPVGSTSPPELYHTKMTQRLAVYDGAGKLYWQKSYESVEYQSTQYTDTMFIPQIFNLPTSLKSGEYIMKVEIGDLLSGRQTESGVAFTVN